MLQQGDRAGARRLEREYLSYSAAEVDYYARLNMQTLGYEPAEIMLLHDNPLNAAIAPKVIDLFVQRSYRFVSLMQAQSDPAYRTPEKYITQSGPMWEYRWAKERGIKVDGRLEPELPKWVVDYAANISRSKRVDAAPPPVEMPGLLRTRSGQPKIGWAGTSPNVMRLLDLDGTHLDYIAIFVARYLRGD